MGLSGWYKEFHKALDTMYGKTEESISLAKKEKMPKFNHTKFEDAAIEVYRKEGFSKDLFNDDPIKGLWEETYRVLSTGVQKKLNFTVDPSLQFALDHNAFVFSGFKTAQSLREVGLTLVDKKRNIRPFDEFLEDVKSIDEAYNTWYLYAEYNNAVAATQMAVKWNEWEKDGDKYNLQYRTALDDRVRDEHAALEGITLPPSDPFWNEYLPPNGWNCRCTAVQVERDRYPESDSAIAVELGNRATEENKQQQFRYNAGKELKLFPPKHPYFKNATEYNEVIMEGATEHLRGRVEDYMEAYLPDDGLVVQSPYLQTKTVVIKMDGVERTLDRARDTALYLAMPKIEELARSFRLSNGEGPERIYYRFFLDKKEYRAMTTIEGDREVLYVIEVS